MLTVPTTAASEHESQHVENCLDQVRLSSRSRRTPTDKESCSQANEAFLLSKGLRSGIQRKAARTRQFNYVGEAL